MDFYGFSAQRALVVEHQFLGGEPAHALDEAAFDLAQIDRPVQRAAAIVQDVDAQHAAFPGHRVDRHF